jgi:hypothetical protein
MFKLLFLVIHLLSLAAAVPMLGLKDGSKQVLGNNGVILLDSQ